MLKKLIFLLIPCFMPLVAAPTGGQSWAFHRGHWYGGGWDWKPHHQFGYPYYKYRYPYNYRSYPYYNNYSTPHYYYH